MGSLNTWKRSVYVADNCTTQEGIWIVRQNIAASFIVFSQHQSLEDITVPVASITKIVCEIERIALYDVQMPCYGHAVDVNQHVTPVKNPLHSLMQWYQMLPRVLDELYQVK